MTDHSDIELDDDYPLITIPEEAIEVISSISAIMGRQYRQLSDGCAFWAATNFHGLMDHAISIEWKKHDENSAKQYFSSAGKWGVIEIAFNPWGEEMDNIRFEILGYCRWHQEHRADPLEYRELDFDEIAKT
tara:strand:+ start:92 stop:487 length:396 start_codon:yes stop_codon:yes gene_type:complete